MIDVDVHEPQGGKITHLFPREENSKGPTTLVVDGLQDQLNELLGEALPQAKYAPPDPNHRNARLCPQCDGITWRATEHCIYCGFNLFAHDAWCAEQDAFHAEALRLKAVDAMRWKFIVAIIAIGIACAGLVVVAGFGPA